VDGFLPVRTDDSVRTDAGPVAWTQENKQINKKSFFILFIYPHGCRSYPGGCRKKILKIVFFFFPAHVDVGRVRANTLTRPRGRTYALTFFLGRWKCKQGVDLGCGRKHFLDQISNPHIWGNNDWIWAFFFFHK
jgi:hypothetical protein